MGWWRLHSVWMTARYTIPEAGQRTWSKRKWDPNVDSSQSWDVSQEESMWEEMRIYWKSHSSHLEVWSAPAKKGYKQVKFNEKVRELRICGLTNSTTISLPHYSKKIVKSNFNYVNVSASSLNMEEASQLGPGGKCIEEKSRNQFPELHFLIYLWPGSNSHNLSKSQIQADAQELL